MPTWFMDENPRARRVVEGELTPEQIADLNAEYYNIYFLPNYPSLYDPSRKVDGSQIDTFQYVFVDMDLKDGTYPDKDSFIVKVGEFPLEPSRIVDSGNGVHVYWEVSDLDALSFLRLQRRLMRHFRTDEAVGQIYQLMRVPGTVNTKHRDAFKPCEEIFAAAHVYTCEALDKVLPRISPDDEAYCQQHFNKTYKVGPATTVNDKLPPKFAVLLRDSEEVKNIWRGDVEDRSVADFRLGHILFTHHFTRDEAMSVLVNTLKARDRAPIHRVSYAENIVDKVWTFEETPNKTELNLSCSVKDILMRSGDDIKGARFPCHKYIDDTHQGFRLSQIIGLVAGSGVGKTAFTLNMFEGFVQLNPQYDHFFVSLEQPANEIAERWRVMCGERTALHDKVHVLSNYDDDGGFRHLSLAEIQAYLMKWKETTGRKIGCVVIDHIGALKKKGRNGENEDLMDICHAMKAFAVTLNVMLVMQSQSSREKAGIGDLELSKDAAYGTMYFEAYCDYLITIWQPLKRCYSDPACPTVTAFKFCKIRHKKKNRDNIQEDECYRMLFDSDTERLREMTQHEEVAFDYWNKQALNKRKKDRKTDLVAYTSRKWTEGEVIPDGKADDNQDPKRV